MNIYDIAKKAGVSTATVSRVLNNSPSISEKTRQHVQNVLDQYDYIPNAMARGLAAKTTGLVGILLGDSTDHELAYAAMLVEQEVNKQNLNAVVCANGNLRANLQQLSNRKLDGLVILDMTLDEELLGQDIARYFPSSPVVVASGVLERKNTFGVYCDAAAGIGLAMEHLFRKGRHAIVYVSHSQSFEEQQKLQGYRSKVAQLAHPSLQEFVVNTAPTFEGGRKATQYIIENLPSFDAILCSRDLIAMGAIFQLQEFGYHVPRDVAVVGYGNTLCGKLAKPYLTSIDGRMEQIACKAGQILCKAIRNQQQEQKIVLQPTLFIGETS